VINIQPVTEEKVGKSRVHLDFWVSDLEAAVKLAERLGAHRLEDHTHGPWTVAVMADPEGIEFCLVA
jgi:predicted enzyme related to lactoylglutathione lyase